MLFLIILLIFIVIILFISIAFAEEIRSTRERDPAATSNLEVILLYPGLHAIISHRLANFLWRKKLPFFPRAISQLNRFITGIEIHPGATIEKGLFIDHGMGIVIGETTIIGKNVGLFQGVTLGGTGKECGKRHPTLGKNIVVGAGAKILGNIEIGSNSYIGANAVILKDVPPNSTVVGVPGHVTKQDGKKIDLMMDHVHVTDPVWANLRELSKKVSEIEKKKK